MKLPITDEFLWNLYNLSENIDDILDIALPPFRKIVFPDLHKVQRIYEKRKAKKSFSNFIYYLKKQGYIKVKNLRNKKGILFTKKGMGKVLKIKFKIKKKKRRKDGRWMMLIFDIPEKKRDLRNLLRETLYLLGYKMLQRSVWVCPYDVLKETEDFIQRNSLDPYIKLFLIKEIEID